MLPAVLATLCVAEMAWLRPAVWQYGVVVEVLACLCLVFRRRLPVVAPTAAGVGIFSLYFIDPELTDPAMYLGIAIAAAFALARWNDGHEGLVGMAVIGTAAAVFSVVDPESDVTYLAFLGCLLIPPYVFGRLTRRLAVQSGLLERQQVVVQQNAVREERERIARDLHDVIAHSLSSIVVQSAAAQELVHTDPTRAGSLLANVSDAGRDALAETGRLLHLIRDDHDELGLAPTPGLSGLDDLVAAFESDGLGVHLHTDPRLPPLSGGADVAAYRVVQESLTNASKYAADRKVDLELTATEHQLRITALNRVGGHHAPGSGLGLLGMRERLAIIGGHLDHRVTPDGRFELIATLPIESAR